MIVLEQVYIPGQWEELIAQNDQTHAEFGVNIERLQAKLDAILLEPDPLWMRAR